VRRVIVPPAAGVFSAVGLLVAERSVSVGGAFPGELTGIDVDGANSLFAGLRSHADRLLEIPEDRATYKLEVEMRYIGQAFELTIPLDEPSFSDGSRRRLRDLFDDEHERRFGHKFDETNQVEIVSLKVRATAPEEHPHKSFRTAESVGVQSERPAYFGDDFGFMTTPVVGRNDLSDRPRSGPLIVEEYEGTTVVPPDASVHRDTYDNIVIDLDYSG